MTPNEFDNLNLKDTTYHGPPTLSQRPGKISIDAMAEAWEMLSGSLAPWIWATVVYCTVCVVLFAFEFSCRRPGPSWIGLPTTASTLVGLFRATVLLWLTSGMVKMAINQVRSGAVDLADLFSAGQYQWTLWVAGLVEVICLIFGLVLCVVPAIYFYVAIALVTCLIVDQEMGALEAVTESWDIITPHWWSMLGMVLLFSVVKTLGLLALGVGVLIAAPLCFLTLAIIYRDLYPKLFPDRFWVLPDTISDEPHAATPPPSPDTDRWLP